LNHDWVAENVESLGAPSSADHRARAIAVAGSDDDE